ncbi:MAG: choline/carnitine O-acyltransferase [Mobilicoccus sp.]|nr:choline/carnitine O-acyltransferase [Mobilicoccus sp.]
MKQLAVPALEETLDRFLTVVEPIVDATTLTTTREAVEAFRRGDGPEAQRLLEEFATDEHAAGRSWLSQAWLDGYLGVRERLPLTSNTVFELAWADGRGVTLAADVAAGFAHVGLQYLRGEYEIPPTPRGDAICPSQFTFLAGGIRRPGRGLDVIEPGSDEAAGREIVVIARGHGYRLVVADDAGQVLPRAALAAALQEIWEATPREQGLFARPAYAGGDDAADLWDELTATTEGRATYDVLRDALFVLVLVENGGSTEEFVQAGLAGVDEAFPYKTVSLRVDLAGGQVGMHMEHSTLDGGTITSVIEAAQHHAPDDDADQAGSGSAAWSSLTWAPTPQLRARLTRVGEAFEHHAAGYRFRIITEPWSLPESVPFPFSLDACCQAVMLYAQLATYGRVRSTYESVDMREFQAGRTECLRPNTPQAVALARALVDDTATPQMLADAMAAHREQVKVAKTGRAVDRHLFALHLIAQREGLAAPLVGDAGYTAMTTDFLSTTSLGSRDQIVRTAFAPTSPGGFGLYYSATPQDIDVCVNVDQSEATHAAFEEALREGARKMAGLLAEAASEDA